MVGLHMFLGGLVSFWVVWLVFGWFGWFLAGLGGFWLDSYFRNNGTEVIFYNWQASGVSTNNIVTSFWEGI